MQDQEHIETHQEEAGMESLAEAFRDTPVACIAETLEQTMERLMDRHGDGLMRLCTMMLSDRALAEDAVQETFFKAYRAYPRFRHDSSEYTWLTRIAINTCHHVRNRAWFRFESKREDMDRLKEVGEEAALPDDTVLQAVMALKPRYKEPVLLFYYQSLPVKEIAMILGIAVSTVSVRLLRAREILKDQLKEWYFED